MRYFEVLTNGKWISCRTELDLAEIMANRSVKWLGIETKVTHAKTSDWGPAYLNLEAVSVLQLGPSTK